MDKHEIANDFKQSLGQLQAALKYPADNDVVKAGCIQYFEFTFELAWKTIKTVAEDEGLHECNSPKSALKTAFSNGWIDEEEVWLDMLSARNKMAHTYDASNALAVYNKLDEFASALKKLADNIDSI